MAYRIFGDIKIRGIRDTVFVLVEIVTSMFFLMQSHKVTQKIGKQSHHALDSGDM